MAAASLLEENILKILEAHDAQEQGLLNCIHISSCANQIATDCLYKRMLQAALTKPSIFRRMDVFLNATPCGIFEYWQILSLWRACNSMLGAEISYSWQD